MALLAIILVTGVFSSGFDWFYPVRVLGTAAAIWFFWRSRLIRLHLAGIWSGSAILIGVAVFVVWLGLERALISPRFTWLSFLLSSFLFGALHGRWLAGTVAGMFYAWAMYRRGRVSDAIMAHATTNALISVDVRELELVELIRDSLRGLCDKRIV